MHIRELISKTGVTERQVRYLISEGFIPSPTGPRSNAEYSDDHVTAIRRYSKLKELGFPPAAIKLLLAANHGVPIPIAEGVTLVVSPDVIGSNKSAEPIIRELQFQLNRLLEEPPNDEQCDAQHD